MGLVEFLTARYYEDEAIARAVPFEHYEAVEYLWETKYLQLTCDNGETGATSEMNAHIADHAARHDPARVLADIAAKRRLLESHDDALLEGDEVSMWMARCLAAPYADHPDYNPAWAVDAA